MREYLDLFCACASVSPTMRDHNSERRKTSQARLASAPTSRCPGLFFPRRAWGGEFTFWLDREGSRTGSSSSSELPESMDSNGFLKLSTVSQNWTNNERSFLSMNSMKYDKDVDDAHRGVKSIDPYFEGMTQIVGHRYEP
ncbi:hypothetical protein PHLCEN_2v10867 [Hermanssonia centrifuga]|uniref:Uncharacterized protein n=1 Tax=Hermanssonia centrifuga TaxID=98765 RepID=A0A2R6NLK6_9APHY|nr:hypothetical protein PHLCEN_2v10867 [Hermanssonia centrifuga]